MTLNQSRWLMVTAAVVALAAGAWVARTMLFVPSVSGQSAAALLGVALPDTDGKDQPLAQWTGKVLVVNFWATWCAPCREEMPMFVRLQREQEANGLQFVGIAVDQADKVRQFAGEIGLNYPALIGGYGAMELSKSLGNSLMALPFTVIVDRGGRVAHTQLGPLKEEQLTSIVKQLL
jgi:thiol-disulfide isomerase/thioredoxin